MHILNRLNTMAAAMIMLAVISLSGCGGSDPEPSLTEAEKVKRILTTDGGTWTPPASGGGILVDGIDVTDDLFPGFSITFQDGTFTTTGTSPVWLRQDTWRFKDDAGRVIIRGQDNREITIEEISDTQLKLTLEWPRTTTVPGDGRQRSLKGKHEFFLNK